MGDCDSKAYYSSLAPTCSYSSYCMFCVQCARPQETRHTQRRARPDLYKARSGSWLARYEYILQLVGRYMSVPGVGMRAYLLIKKEN